MKSVPSGKQKGFILCLLFLGWSLGNLDRFVISYAVLGIATDLSLKATQTGMLLSSFFLGYTLMQAPGGYLADRFGYRKVIVIALLSWSIFTLLTGAAWSLVSMIIIRILFGLGEGGFIPSASKAITSWFPPHQRGRAMSLLLASGAVIGIITPLLAVGLMRTFGWRAMFEFFGVCGLLVTFLMFLFLKEKREGLPASLTEKGSTVQPKVPLAIVLKTPMVWSFLIASFSLYAVLWGLTSWMPTYLVKARDLDLTTVSYVLAISALVSIIATFLSGFLLDKMSTNNGRKVASVCALLVGVLLYLMSAASSLPLYVLYFCLLNLFLPFISTFIPTAVLKTLPVALTGSASGLINTGAQAAGILTPLAIGFMIDASGGSYRPAFFLLIAFSMLCVGALVVARMSKATDMSAAPSTMVPPETLGTEI